MRLGIKIVLVLVRRHSKSVEQHMFNISTWYRKSHTTQSWTSNDFEMARGA